MLSKYCIVILAILGPSLKAFDDGRSGDEALAVRYMEAMVRQEFEVAADLLAPSVMEAFKQVIVKRAREVEAQTILKELGYRDLASLESVPSKDFFIRQLRRMRPPSDTVIEKLRKVSAKVVSVEDLADGRRRLNLMLVADGVPNQPATVVIGVVDGKRMVVGL